MAERSSSDRKNTPNQSIKMARFKMDHTLSLEQRFAFWLKRCKKKPSECWEWPSLINDHGYGILFFHYRRYRAHRISWRIAKGSIPVGKFVLHRCDNRRCINPRHLWLGNHQDNMDDMRTKGRSNRIPHANPVRGEAVGSAVLNREQVMAIYQDPRGQKTIGREYGVNRISVRNIKRGKTWSHVTGHPKMPWRQTSLTPALTHKR